MTVSATALGAALQVRDGLFQPWAIVWLTVAFAACMAVLILPARGNPPTGKSGWRRVLLTITLVAGSAVGWVQLLTSDLPGSWHGVRSDWRFRLAMTCAAWLVVGIVVFPRHARTCFGLLVATFLVTGIWIIRSVPEPYMDVWMLQTQSARVFHEHGVNPYAAVYPDVYQRPELYAPGAIRDGLVYQGYPYPPVAFWMTLAGYSLAGDFRYAGLAAIAGTAVLIGLLRPGRVPLLAGAMFLFTPRAFFVLESGWTEPFSALLLAATVFLACRVHGRMRPVAERGGGGQPRAVAAPNASTPILLAVALGLFLASKQYLIFAAPPAVLLLGQPLRWRRVARFAGVAFAAGCVISLPLILWDVKAFLQSTAGFAGLAEFRTDALNYLALFATLTGRVPSASLASGCGFAAAGLAVAAALYRLPRTPAGYAAAVAVVYYAFFAFYKFAFCNYYYFILAACCCAIGANATATPAAAPAAENES